jgi:DeoR/GlpR family transcriptional regulator of sugar metabolism
MNFVLLVKAKEEVAMKENPKGNNEKVKETVANEANPGEGMSTNFKGYTPYQSGMRLDVKKAIANYIVKKIIEDGMSIFLDAGSTIHQVGIRLFDDSCKKSGLTIMTNNMLVFKEFTEKSVKMSERGNVLSLTGGVYNQNHEALFGQAAEQVLKSFYPRVVLIGTSGFMVGDSNSEHHGAFHHDLVSEVQTKKAIALMRTLHRVIVCDYSKIGVWDASCFATIHELAENTDKCTIITSKVPSNIEQIEREYYEKKYKTTIDALEKSKIQNVKMIRVDEKGNVV